VNCAVVGSGGIEHFWRVETQADPNGGGKEPVNAAQDRNQLGHFTRAAFTGRFSFDPRSPRAPAEVICHA